MFQDPGFCPYAGLRPFTEDESIYFKGRDEHIDQATKQLERNKFMIVTGASGDGKSSLVYAGIIPNAKAGFLKAAYSNWTVTDFRPERSPMRNLSHALARALGINESTVLTELGYGFSALVDMYKASPLYFDPLAESAATGDAGRARARQSSNLIILADQFEEFFTNPENFHNGVPSQESVSVTNLLLETARLALAENLPIYVILTMRSDFIGQCAAFRGLPEYIGFSQFFLPRLNRKELREVIEEPAILNGNSISRRLTERLIYDIEDGADQLPILQHALNQIWKMADSGTVEMDLIHYAMVGGIGAGELSTEGSSRFKEWFKKLPAKVQECYYAPNLKNVLNTHANKLYSLAWDNLSATEQEKVSEEGAREIITATFKCLTKIDNNRAVRNRMTLDDITSIIAKPGVDAKLVGNVLSIFRDPGNTLLRPFTDRVPVMDENEVLDITHESLIRNWDKLNEWAKEEFASYNISVDFDTQLKLWLEHGRSSDFLMSIGALTYFESWLKTQKVNAHWIGRYLKNDDPEERKKVAARIESNAKDFMQRSMKKHQLTRTLLRYSNRKTGIILGLIVLLTLTSFVARNYLTHQNNYILERLRDNTFELINNPNVSLTNRSALGIEAVRLKQTSMSDLLLTMPDPYEGIRLANNIAMMLNYQGFGEPWEEIRASVRIADSLLSALPPNESRPKNLSLRAKLASDLRETLEMIYFYKPVPEVDTLRQKNARRCAAYALHILRTQPSGYTDINYLNLCLEHAINYKAFSDTELSELSGILSPFDAKQTSWISSNYDVKKAINKGFFGGFTHNGLYQELAYLFAAQGDFAKTSQCLDTLLKYNSKYAEGEYARNSDNAAHIAGVFYKYAQLASLDQFVTTYTKKVGITSEKFYALLLARCKLYEFATVVTPMLDNYDHELNLLLEFSDSVQLRFFFDKYRDAVMSNFTDADAQNFHLALSYKDEGILNIRRLEVTGQTDVTGFYRLFDKAMEYYQRVGEKYLNENIQIVELSSQDKLNVKRKFLFTFPDVRTAFHPNEPRLYHFFYVSQAFLKYIMDRDLFGKIYIQPSDLTVFEYFFRDYLYIETELAYTMSKGIDYDVLAATEKRLSQMGTANLNMSLLYLYAGIGAAQHNQKEAALNYFGKVNPAALQAQFVNTFDPTYVMRVLGRSTAYLAQFGDFKTAKNLIETFRLPENRATMYAFSSQQLSRRGVSDGQDSLLSAAALNAMKTKPTNNARAMSRLLFVYAQALHENDTDITAAYKIIKNVEFKVLGTYLLCRGLAFQGKLYEAYNNVIADPSDEDFALFTTGICRGYGDSMPPPDESWSEYLKGNNTLLDSPLRYVDEYN